MRNALLLLLLVLFCAPALAQDFVRLRKKQYHHLALDGRCVIDANYVEVVGRPDLNAKIKALLPGPCDPADLEPGQMMKIEQDFTVTYNEHGLLSVYGTGLQMLTRDGQMIGAHPSKLFSGITLEINTAREYSLRDMFGADVYKKLDDTLAMQAAAVAGSDVLYPVTGHTYHCYLSKNGVTFYQLFDNFALGSLEVTLPYSQAIELANPTGPLARLR